MGRVAGAYGVNGWLRVMLYGDTPDTLSATPSWQIGAGEYAVTATRFHSGTLLAKLSGIETREAALKPRGETVAVPREALPARER